MVPMMHILQLNKIASIPKKDDHKGIDLNSIWPVQLYDNYHQNAHNTYVIVFQVSDFY